MRSIRSKVQGNYEFEKYPVVALFHTAPNFAETDYCRYIVRQAQYSDPRSWLMLAMYILRLCAERQTQLFLPGDIFLRTSLNCRKIFR